MIFSGLYYYGSINYINLSLDDFTLSANIDFYNPCIIIRPTIRIIASDPYSTRFSIENYLMVELRISSVD